MKTTDQSVAERLKAAMERRAVSNVDLAKAIGVSQATISQWTNAITRDYKADHMVRAADFLRVRVQWLLFGEGAMTVAPIAASATELVETVPVDILERTLGLLEYELTKSVARDPRVLGHYLKLIDDIIKRRKE